MVGSRENAATNSNAHLGTPPRSYPCTVNAFVFGFLVASNRDTAWFRVVSGGTGCYEYTVDPSGLVEVPNTGARKTYATFEGLLEATNRMMAGL